MQISINIEGPKLPKLLRWRPSSYKPSLKVVNIVSGVVVFVCVLGLSLLMIGHKNPLPAAIKSQVSYSVFYPAKTSLIDSKTYDYKSDSKTLSFNVKQSSDNNIVVTEQPAPDSLASNGQVYYPALGIHPYAQFVSKFGPVALAKFWESGTLKEQGQSAILAHNGTLFIAHSEKPLSNAAWKDFVNSLKIAK